jgi:tetraprenyl-beta-curcumene synthase
MKVHDVPRSRGSLAGIGAAVTAFGTYRAVVVPPTRRLIASWRQRAATIPDPGLRAAALSALDEKRANVEATAVFATLAPRAGRKAVVRAGVALQVAVDYLDTVGEASDAADPLADGLRLHGALPAALTPGAAAADWYAERPGREDGGYLGALVRACQDTVAALPSATAVLPRARDAARRCGEGQSLTHAGTAAALEEWAGTLDAPADLRWWEAAAGASSSVAAHALLALAATPGADAAGAERVAHAYDPWIGALTVLLDDLVDRDADSAEGEHSYLAHYRSLAEAAGRIDLIASRADAALDGLPRRHRAILAGVLSHYLGANAPELREALGAMPPAAATPDVRFLTAAARLL